MKQLFNVILAWGQTDEGNYTATVAAPTDGAAALLVAEEMAESRDAPKFDDDADRQQWIARRAADVVDIYPTDVQLRQDLGALFSDELYPDGVVREINLEELGRVLSENRDRLLLSH